MSEAKERLIREMAEARHFPFRGEEFSRRISDAIEALIDERIAAARRAGIRKWTPELVGKVEAMLNDPEDNWIIGDELPPKAEPPAGGRRRCAESPCPHCGAIAEPQPSAEAMSTTHGKNPREEALRVVRANFDGEQGVPAGLLGDIANALRAAIDREHERWIETLDGTHEERAPHRRGNYSLGVADTLRAVADRLDPEGA